MNQVNNDIIPVLLFRCYYSGVIIPVLLSYSSGLIVIQFKFIEILLSVNCDTIQSWHLNCITFH